MNTYNFFLKLGEIEQIIDVNAYSEEEAIEIIRNEYSSEDGWIYILL